jgi:hypothetical protein
MAATIPNLWSDDIKVDILTPLVILRSQAGLLGQMTRGLLEAEVSTVTSDTGVVQHHLDLIAPALRYRHRVLAVKHSRELVYPVAVEAECFQPKPKSWTTGEIPAPSKPSSFPVDPEDGRPKANTEQEFIDLVSKVLHSSEVRSIIQSLIARSNEQRSDSATPPSTEDDIAQA